jgi:hypothetical protein
MAPIRVRVTYAAIVALLALTAVMVEAPTAQAYVLHGCEYATGSIDPISYRYY